MCMYTEKKCKSVHIHIAPSDINPWGGPHHKTKYHITFLGAFCFSSLVEHTRTHMRITHTHTHTHARAHTHTHTHTHTYTHTHTHIHARKRACTQAHAHSARTHTHIHTDVSVCIYVCALASSWIISLCIRKVSSPRFRTAFAPFTPTPLCANIPRSK